MTVRKTIALAAFTFIAGVLTTAGVLGLLAGEPAQAQTPTPTPTAQAPTPGPATTPTPTPTLAQRVAANTSSIQTNTSSIHHIGRELGEQGDRIAALETRHAWDCAALLAEYDAEIADWADNQLVTAVEADAFAIGAVKTHMNRADRNAHWQTTWYDAGVKAELFKRGLRTISMFR